MQSLGVLYKECITPLLSVDYVPYFLGEYNVQNAPSLGTVLTTARKPRPQRQESSAKAETLEQGAKPGGGSAKAEPLKRRRRRGPRKRAAPSKAKEVEEQIAREADERGDGAVPYRQEANDSDEGKAGDVGA